MAYYFITRASLRFAKRLHLVFLLIHKFSIFVTTLEISFVFLPTFVCFIKKIYYHVHWSDGMRCCRSDWPGLCLFCCYQPLCVVSQQRWFGLFFCFINFPIISTFTPIFFIEISFVLLPPPPLEWWDAVLQKRLAWALFVLLLSTLVCCQPKELIWAFFFFCFLNYLILLPQISIFTPIFFIEIFFVLPPPVDPPGFIDNVCVTAAIE